jgi:N-acetylglucosamine malate deacetylase 2
MWRSAVLASPDLAHEAGSLPPRKNGTDKPPQRLLGSSTGAADVAIKRRSLERDRLRLSILQSNGATSTAAPPWRDLPVCVIVAHPDDETIGCGAQLTNSATVVVATDGAPLNLVDAKAHGYDTACAYAAARAREFRRAMRVAGVDETSLIQIGVPDQDAARHIADMARVLAGVIAAKGIRCAITHAYEGGHPDHDAVACAASASCRLLARNGYAVSLYEMPLYRQGANRELHQTFASNESAPELTLCLDADGQARKRRMLACYLTQRHTISGFAIGTERFREMPRHDFTVLPNNGALLYERRDWGLRTGAEWRELAAQALIELDLIERSV